MDLNNKEYIILEIIPTAIHPSKGDIIQLQALKLNGIKLIDRFDYRLKEDKISIPQFIDMISYDKEQFTYKETTKEILNDFKEWTNNLPLLILNNTYTNNILEELTNEKQDILKYLDMEYTDNVIEDIIKKYQLEPSNHIVDLLYESLIKSI